MGWFCLSLFLFWLEFLVVVVVTEFLIWLDLLVVVPFGWNFGFACCCGWLFLLVVVVVVVFFLVRISVWVTEYWLAANTSTF